MARTLDLIGAEEESSREDPAKSPLSTFFILSSILLVILMIKEIKDVKRVLDKLVKNVDQRVICIGFTYLLEG